MAYFVECVHLLLMAMIKAGDKVVVYPLITDKPDNARNAESGIP